MCYDVGLGDVVRREFGSFQLNDTELVARARAVEFSSYVPKEDTFPQENTYNFGCVAKRAEPMIAGTPYCGSKIFRIFDWFHAIHTFQWILLKQIQATTRPFCLWPENVDQIVKSVSTKEKQQWAFERTRVRQYAKVGKRSILLLGLFPLGLRVLDAFSLILLHKRIRRWI